MKNTEAIELLRRELGADQYFSVSGETTHYSSGRIEHTIRVYDGRQSYDGATLDEAVRACLNAHKPPGVNEEEVEAVISNQ